MTGETRVALVPGGATGVGSACVRALAARGVRVAVLDEDVTEVQAGALDGSARVVGHQVPWGDATALKAAVDAVATQLGRIDVLVNAVLETGPETLTDVTQEAWRRCVDASMKVPFFALQACVPHMRTVGGGRVVNLSSTLSALSDGRHQVVHGITAAGVNSMSRQWAVDLSPDNIQTNSVWLGHDDPSALPPADQVASFVAWLALDAPEHINGAQIVADGGAALLRQGRIVARPEAHKSELQMEGTP